MIWCSLLLLLPEDVYKRQVYVVVGNFSVVDSFAEIGIGSVRSTVTNGFGTCLLYTSYTNPEIAGVGETEESASAKGITCQVIKLSMAYSGRFVAENEGVNGVCKVLLDEQERVIGAHVLGLSLIHI